jgi:hypothetical protein
MTNLKRTHAIATVFRMLLESKREIAALKAILQVSAQKRVCPLDWEDQLKAARTFPQYSDIGRELESSIARYQQDADETELLELFRKMSQEGPPN